jgi:hypothetical protein
MTVSLTPAFMPFRVLSQRARGTTKNEGHPEYNPVKQGRKT